MTFFSMETIWAVLPLPALAEACAVIGGGEQLHQLLPVRGLHDALHHLWIVFHLLHELLHIQFASSFPLFSRQYMMQNGK